MEYRIEFIIIFVYILSIVIFLKFSKNLDTSDKKVFLWKIVQPLVFIYVVGKYFMLPLTNLVWLLFIGCFIGFIFPIIFGYYNRDTNMEICLDTDFRMGFYFTLLLECLEIILTNYIGVIWAGNVITTLIVVITLPAVMQVVYAILYGRYLDPIILQTLMYTHLAEIKEYLRTLGKGKVISIIVGYFVFICIVAKITFATFIEENILENSFWYLFPLLFYSFYLLFIRKNSLVMSCGIGEMITDLVYYQEQLKSFMERNNGLEALNIECGWTENKIGTFIVVIGESANRKHMSAFTDYDRETTPWLSKMVDEKKCILFKNTYSSYVQTAACLSMSLTNINQYNNLDFLRSFDIIDVANKSGFNTYWYSNQGIAGVNNTPITVIAKGCKKYRWVMEDYPTVQYDDKLLEYLKNISLNDNDNKLIFIHLKGSHSEFICRYPERFAKFSVKSGDNIGRDAYDNTILYTDYILKQIYEYGHEKLNMQAMVYFSDHSTNVGVKRQSYFDGFDAVRVPMFVYLSEKYKDVFPDVAVNLNSNKDKYFTNDCMFDLFLGIMKINFGNKYDIKYDISSADYNYKPSDLLTNLGRVKLSEDSDC